MSAPGPESIPTSADPRSHRPTKKRALTPVSAQAASVDALFAKPDQLIRIPDGSSSTSSNRPPPPEIVTNVQGSSAGAGSGEFHVYKASRRREYERLREMDEVLKREKDQEQFDKDKSDRDRKDDERTRKNREKREKMKARKAKKGKGPAPGADKKQSTASPTGDEPANGADKGTGEEKSTSQNKDAKSGDEQPKTTSEPVGLVIHDDD